VLPTDAIGNASEQVVFQNAHAIEPAFSVAGTTDEWRDHVAALAQGNSRMVFSICVALAGPLLEPAGEDSGGFHLRGPSSTGKSTALQCSGTRVFVKRGGIWQNVLYQPTLIRSKE
jgi:uncharacterized protein (DUF927 family)